MQTEGPGGERDTLERLAADEATLDELERNRQVIFRYCDADGRLTSEANPNGASGRDTLLSWDLLCDRFEQSWRQGDRPDPVQRDSLILLNNNR